MTGMAIQHMKNFALRNPQKGSLFE